MENILVIASEESVVHSQPMWIEEDEAKQVGISSWAMRAGQEVLRDEIEFEFSEDWLLIHVGLPQTFHQSHPVSLTSPGDDVGLGQRKKGSKFRANF